MLAIYYHMGAPRFGLRLLRTTLWRLLLLLWIMGLTNLALRWLDLALGRLLLLLPRIWSMNYLYTRWCLRRRLSWLLLLAISIWLWLRLTLRRLLIPWILSLILETSLWALKRLLWWLLQLRSLIRAWLLWTPRRLLSTSNWAKLLCTLWRLLLFPLTKAFSLRLLYNLFLLLLHIIWTWLLWTLGRLLPSI